MALNLYRNKLDLQSKNKQTPMETTKEETKEVSETKSSECVEFVSYFLGCSTMLHIMHMQNSNPAIHGPLGELYSAVQDSIDSIVEKYQGYSGSLITGYQNYNLAEYEGMNPLTYVEELKAYLEKERYEAFSKDNSPLQNEVDELANSINKCIFLLKFNKPL